MPGRGTPDRPLQRRPRWRTASMATAFALLCLAIPFGAGQAATTLPTDTPEAFSGKIEGYAVHTISGGTGIAADDPSSNYAEGDLQALLQSGAIPYQIKGIAATVNYGFLGTAVLFGAPPAGSQPVLDPITGSDTQLIPPN